MKAPASEARTGVLGTMKAARRQLVAAIEGLPPGEMMIPADGGWSVKDIHTSDVKSWQSGV